jgi:hypothetical protein
MKKAAFLLILLAFVTCSPEKLEISKAKIVAENLIRTIDREKYSEVSKFYTKSFNESEPADKRTEKFKALKSVKGDLKNFILTDSVNEAKSAEEPKIILTYQINYTKLTTLETFTIIYDEGDYRVSSHSLASINK